MTKPDVPLKPSQTTERTKSAEPTPLEIQNRLRMIDQVLRMRFADYSPNVEELEPLNSVLDLETLDDVFGKACYEETFEEFRLSVTRICCRYETLVESERVEPRLILANVFNNHVATILGKPGEITAQFLRMSVRRISSELAEQLDFERAKSEPTVFVFGNNVSRICDLIFTIPYKDGRDEVFPIIVLMEHKSTPDKNVVKQMLTSLVATLDFAERYPERFKTKDGKTVWPFVVLFYTGAQKWNEVQNLPDLFTTSLKELDRDWIFNLRFLLISLVHKKIDVAPTIEGGETPSETFDEALQDADWLAFFFDLLRKAEILTSNPDATREEWLNDAGESLRFLKDVYDPDNEYDDAVLDDALCLISTMCAKKNFALPTRDELVGIMEKEEIEGMVRRTWLLTDEERKAAELKGRNDGWNDGWNEGRNDGWNEGRNEGERNVLAQLIGVRFPTATSEFIEKALKRLRDPSDVRKMTSAAALTDTLEEFQRRIQALTPGC